VTACETSDLRRSVFEVHVTVRRGHILLTSIVCHYGTLHVVRCTQAQCTAGASCGRMTMEYAHDDYCEMLFTLVTYYNGAGTVGSEYSLRYPGGRHIDA
jgi:hypothetical protein